MPGIIISIDPVLLRAGPLELRWYGLFVGLALLAGYAFFMSRVRSAGLPAGPISSSFPWLILAGLAGARAFHVIDRWSYYVNHPFSIFNLRQGGLAVWGGILGGSAAALLVYRSRGLPAAVLADAAAPALLVGQIIGRLGCIVNGDAYGGPTDLPWAFVYTHPDALIPDGLRGIGTHPYPVYEMLWNGASLALLLLLGKQAPRRGTLFFAYLVLYSAGRLGLSSTRQERFVLWDLQQAQVLGAAVLLGALAAWVFLRKGGRR